ncbi:3-dehydroquinate dehydratase 1 [Candidatus Kinetoplastibacterium sorsogonicusi]|uniref:3-dehydroquinate dehydratase n=1 Tax=Candidatus Kinetoplastidibacterium kentomonadis TaxID=1576550 RepID=A0A3Q8ERQ1_9PROT|nr:type II 3-dehydroquinate dehydratase [Candidatus Kinetoplastibacterium sorsogonicusi]AWD32697.1 3-dehydroquinate dehydratase 1 [Candidatus Kinetoplastibacterium sorsogonicusi]
MAKNILVLNGPNLNLLGVREPKIYGSNDIFQINQNLEDIANRNGSKIFFYQSNHEGDLIDKIHDSKNNGVDFIIINAAAYTHTSIALRDAMSATEIPFIEVHISNVFKREKFRHISYISDIAIGVISGLGIYGYEAALIYALNHEIKNF